MPPTSEVFEQTVRSYLRQLSEIDGRARADILGAGIAGSGLIIPFYGTPYRVSGAGITDAGGRPANFSICVVLCKYILMAPTETPADGNWATYREFKDAGPLTVFFANNTHKTIENAFGADSAALETACRKLGGTAFQDDASHDLSMLFHALPRIPVLLRFNFRDDDLPAQCTVLFRRSAEKYLDMESLAIAGTFLAGGLIKQLAG
ncbi:MAG: DUF3786 domain-containing protein [Desulfobacterales bacterium]|nr:DUF3786 domain-containing protein [Desulfobacterales bacterium]